MKTELATTQQLSVTDLSTVSKTFFESGMFSDIKSASQAMVKIMAGAEVGLPAFQSMSGIHIIQGKPVMGAGLIASKVKGSGKYDYKVKQMDEKACSIDFFQGKENIGNSTFTIEDAKKAQTKNLDKFPKNMLFARAISNGVKWFCPDVFSGPVYVPEEMEVQQTEDAEHVDITETKKPVLKLGTKSFNNAVSALKGGKTLEDIKAAAEVSEEVESALIAAVEEAA